MAGQFINVNDEMNYMKKCIGNAYFYTSKIQEIEDASWMYKTNFKINLLTIIATVYMLVCAVIKYYLVKYEIYYGSVTERCNLIVIGTGIVIAVFTGILIFKKNIPASDGSVKTSKACGALICLVIVTSIIFYFFYTNFLPVIASLINWLVVIISNFKMKKKIWNISQGI